MGDESGPLTTTKYDYMSIEDLEEEIDCLKQDMRIFATDYHIVQHCKNELEKAEEAMTRLQSLINLRTIMQ